MHHIDTRFTGCGYRVGDESLEITKLPKHKRPQLLLSKGVECEVLATFADEDATRKFMVWMNRLVEKLAQEKKP